MTVGRSIRKSRLKSAVIDGYHVQWKDDGVRYIDIWRQLKDGRLEGLVKLHTGRPTNRVFRLETERGPLVLKNDLERDCRLEKKLWSFLAGPWYSRLIRLTERAIGRGCDVAQDVYLVAEKMEGRFCVEAWLIAEFVEGTEAPRLPDYSARFQELADTVGRLHDFGLASNDAHGSNFIITASGKVVIIDLTLTSPLLVCQANDILKFKRTFKVDVPVRGFWRRLAFMYVKLKYTLQMARRQKRNPL